MSPHPDLHPTRTEGGQMSAPLFDLIREQGQECICGHFLQEHAEEKLIFQTGSGDLRASKAPRAGGCLSTLHGTSEPCTCAQFQPETGVLEPRAKAESNNYRARANEWIAANPAA